MTIALNVPGPVAQRRCDLAHAGGGSARASRRHGQKIAAIESRRKLVEDVQARANTITSLLDAVNVNLEILGQQKAVVDHIGEKLARLGFMVQEAQNTLRALQSEREVAWRIEQSIKSLRTRTSVGESKTA